MYIVFLTLRGATDLSVSETTTWTTMTKKNGCKKIEKEGRKKDEEKIESYKQHYFGYLSTIFKNLKMAFQVVASSILHPSVI